MASNLSNIVLLFHKSGLWPLCVRQICKNGIREAWGCDSIVLQQHIVNNTRHEHHLYRRHGASEMTVTSAFVDTTFDIELTQKDVLETLKDLAYAHQEKQELVEGEFLEKLSKEAHKKER